MTKIFFKFCSSKICNHSEKNNNLVLLKISENISLRLFYLIFILLFDYIKSKKNYAVN